ncbi:MAG: hypothetical protein ACKVGW_16770, partial [Verrucomicrobiia bacterium]
NEISYLSTLRGYKINTIRNVAIFHTKDNKVTKKPWLRAHQSLRDLCVLRGRSIVIKYLG